MTAAAQAQDTADEALGAIRTHEAVCAERYRHIRDDIGEIKQWLRWGLVAVIGAFGTIAWSLAEPKLTSHATAPRAEQHAGR